MPGQQLQLQNQPQGYDWNALIGQKHSKADFIIENYEFLLNEMIGIVYEEPDMDENDVVTLFNDTFSENPYIREIFERYEIENATHGEPKWKITIRFMRHLIETLKLESETMKVLNKEEVKKMLSSDA